MLFLSVFVDGCWRQLWFLEHCGGLVSLMIGACCAPVLNHSSKGQGLLFDKLKLKCGK